MAKNPTLNVTVHVKDETVVEVSRVPSSIVDFVSLKIGWEVNVLLMNPSQAKALVDAAIEAFRTLKQIETDAETATLASVYKEDGSHCTVNERCSACLTFIKDGGDMY